MLLGKDKIFAHDVLHKKKEICILIQNRKK